MLVAAALAAFAPAFHAAALAAPDADGAAHVSDGERGHDAALTARGSREHSRVSLRTLPCAPASCLALDARHHHSLVATVPPPSPWQAHRFCPTGARSPPFTTASRS